MNLGRASAWKEDLKMSTFAASLLKSFRYMKNIAIIFGGKSPEHQISVRSARNIHTAIDRTQFNTIDIGIDRKGKWWLTNLRIVST